MQSEHPITNDDSGYVGEEPVDPELTDNQRPGLFGIKRAPLFRVLGSSAILFPVPLVYLFVADGWLNFYLSILAPAVLSIFLIIALNFIAGTILVLLSIFVKKTDTDYALAMLTVFLLALAIGIPSLFLYARFSPYPIE